MIESIREVKTKKLKKAFMLLKWISVAPGVDAKTLGRLLGLSERGVYRYIKDLREIGITVRTKERRGYVLEHTDLLGALRLPATGPESVGIVTYRMLHGLPLVTEAV